MRNPTQLSASVELADELPLGYLGDLGVHELDIKLGLFRI